jgi:hypothetical protein
MRAGSIAVSWLSNATGIHLGNIGAPIGAALGSVIPGVGTAIGAGLGGAIGGMGHGDGLKSSLLQGALSGGGAAALGGLASKIPGVSSAESAITGKLGSIPGVQGASDFLKSHGGLGSLLGQAGDFLGGNGGKNALGLAQGANAALLQKKSNEYASNAMGSVQGSWDARAPLRTQGQAQMLNPGAGIAARIAAVPQGANPYAPQTPQIAPVGPRP